MLSSTQASLASAPSSSSGFYAPGFGFASAAPHMLSSSSHSAPGHHSRTAMVHPLVAQEPVPSEDLDDYAHIENLANTWTEAKAKSFRDKLLRTKSTIPGLTNEKLYFLLNTKGDPVPGDSVSKINSTLVACLEHLVQIGRMKRTFKKLDRDAQNYILVTLHNTYLCLRLGDPLMKAKMFAIAKVPDWTRTHMREDGDAEDDSDDGTAIKVPKRKSYPSDPSLELLNLIPT